MSVSESRVTVASDAYDETLVMDTSEGRLLLSNSIGTDEKEMGMTPSSSESAISRPSFTLGVGGARVEAKNVLGSGEEAEGDDDDGVEGEMYSVCASDD